MGDVVDLGGGRGQFEVVDVTRSPTGPDRYDVEKVDASAVVTWATHHIETALESPGTDPVRVLAGNGRRQSVSERGGRV